MVAVECSYEPELSNPMQSENMFSYKITIENQNPYSVKLLRRHWYIFDSLGDYHEVEGEGVVGLLPIIEPMSFFRYTSGCNLKSDIGRMHGHYTMLNQANMKQFKVSIPPFELIAPFKSN